MSEMVERVADAIMETSRGSFSGEMCDVIARAAIEAMREPTEAMQRAIPPQDYTIQHYYGTGHHATFPTLGSGPLQIWHSMIDAALNEEG